MYLHIGNGVSIKHKDIIGIFDLDTATVSGTTKKFLNKKSKEGNLQYTDDDLPRSFVLCSDNKKYRWTEEPRVSKSRTVRRSRRR